MQPTTHFLKGNSYEVYERVFLPLSKDLNVIKFSKTNYGCSPFVKLRTVHEDNPRSVQLSCVIVDSAYTSKFNSFCTGTTKLLTESRNLFGTVLNFASPNSMWNCLAKKTAETLETATRAFSERVNEMKAELTQEVLPQDLKDLKDEITQIQTTLNSALKTVFYVYRTYNQNPGTDQGEDLVSSNEHETLRPQYVAIHNLINQDLCLLFQDIDMKLNPPKDPVVATEPVNCDDLNDISVEVAIECLKMDEPKGSFAPNEMSNRTLVFKTQLAAFKWFESALQRCRKLSEMVTGVNSYSNLMNAARIAKTVPQAFVAFAKSLDKTFVDKLVHYDAVEQVYGRFTALLEANGRKLELKAPNNFKSLLKELCDKKVPREVYQDFFRALMNPECTAPFGLKYEGALLNAIMNSEYFPMFDRDHQVS